MFESVVAQKLAERGLAQGLAQGLKQGRILSILDLINERFGSTGVAQTKPTLESIEDLDILRQLLVKASEAQTFEEFRQALNALTSESVNR